MNYIENILIDNLIKSINILYNQPINNNIKINIIVDYFNNNKNIFNKFKIYYENDKKNMVNEILFNRFHQEEIIDDAIKIYLFLNNKGYNCNYNDYVKIIKNLIEYHIKHININKIKNNVKLMNNDFNYILSNINNLIPIPFNNYKYNITNEKSISSIKNKNINNYNNEIQKYSLQYTKKLDDNLILYSYLCYFKTAINCLRHNIIFKFTNPFFTDSLKEPSYNNCDNSIFNFKQKGGNNSLWYKLCNNEDIISLVKQFNINTQNKYLIGLIGIKYYPYQILNEIFKIFNNTNENNFINNNIKLNNNEYILNLNNEDINYQKNNNLSSIINIKLENNNNNIIFISTIFNDPMKYNVFTNLYNLKYNYNNIKYMTKNKLIEYNNYQYKYNYLIGNYYLESFCLIENENNGIDFHNIYIKLHYGNNFKCIRKIVRYDNFVKIYGPMQNNFMNDELKIFKEKYIKDNFNIKNDKNYKISLLCYIKKDIYNKYH